MNVQECTSYTFWDPSTNEAVLDNLNRDSQVVFFVGSGISAREPSCLPLGLGLSRGLIEATTPSKFSEDLEDLYGAFQDLGIDKSFPRPETILEILYRIGGIELVQQSLKFMADPEPNSNHHSLANLAREGAHIFTTNFDRLIEASLKLQNASNATLSRVSHVHGHINDARTLVATVSGITRPLPEEHAAALKSQIISADLLLVAGYSASDVFDISPVLESAFRNSKGHLIWLQHWKSRTTNIAEARQSVPRKVSNLVNRWSGKKSIVAAPTEQVFEDLGSNLEIQLPKPRHDSFNWEAALRSHLSEAPITPDRRELVAAAFSDFIGCGSLALKHSGNLNGDRSLTASERLRHRQYRRSGLRITGRYLEATCSSIRSALLSLGSLPDIEFFDFLEELYAINYEWRVYGQKDAFVCFLSTTYLLLPSALLHVSLAVKNRSGQDADRARILKHRNGAYWAFMLYLASGYLKGSPSETSGWLLKMLPRIIKKSLAKMLERIQGNICSRYISSEIWDPDDRNTLLSTLPNSSTELDLVTDELEQLLAAVNLRRNKLTQRVSQTAHAGVELHHELDRLASDLRDLAKASRILGDKPGHLKAKVLIARLNDLRGRRKDATATRREALALLEEIHWSKRAHRYWLHQIKDPASDSPTRWS